MPGQHQAPAVAGAVVDGQIRLPEPCGRLLCPDAQAVEDDVLVVQARRGDDLGHGLGGLVALESGGASLHFARTGGSCECCFAIGSAHGIMACACDLVY